MTQRLGKLAFEPGDHDPTLLAAPVNELLMKHTFEGVWACAINPELADTAAFCEHYDIGMDVSANCVIVEAKRGERVWYAACIILATTKADVNGAVRRALDARKVSFAPMDIATSLTRMEYGGITPIGLPADWPILIDSKVMGHEKLIVGSGLRGSKILISSEKLSSLPSVQILDISK